MKINIRQSKELFLAFLLTSSLPNTIKELQPVGKRFVDDFLLAFPEQISEIHNMILETEIEEGDEVRLVNDFINSDFEYINQETKDDYLKILSDSRLNQLFSDYEVESTKILGNTDLVAEIEKINRLFQIDSNNEITIHINLLDTCCRGTNYYEIRTISISPNDEGEISLRALRHEYTHIVLKDLLLDFDFPEISIQVDSDYEIDSARIRFDENFVIATNLFFDDEKTARGTLKYLAERGFAKLPTFYDFIAKNFVEQKQQISRELIQKLIEEL
jgi:hypothetical protein